MPSGTIVPKRFLEKQRNFTFGNSLFSNLYENGVINRLVSMWTSTLALDIETKTRAFTSAIRHQTPIRIMESFSQSIGPHLEYRSCIGFGCKEVGVVYPVLEREEDVV